ncbi:hypothetical protein [Nisaea denitrificans]|uniref:hypothetical protein n=1 Tax=Nisaea denitrificans TaxID=390877 RepID=UPI0004914D63|nr:hypothetical protein [Nisaea denitrificans]
MFDPRRLLVSLVTEPVLFPGLRLRSLLLLSLVFFIPPVFWIVGFAIDMVVIGLTFGLFSPLSDVGRLSGFEFLVGFYGLFLLILFGFYWLNRWCSRTLVRPIELRSTLERLAPIILNIYFFVWILSLPACFVRFFVAMQTVIK